MMSFGVWFWIFFAFIDVACAGYYFGGRESNKGMSELIGALGCILFAIARYFFNRG